MRGIVQVAGVRDLSEAEMLAGCGVDWIGLPLRLAYHRPDLDEAEAAALIRALPPRVAPVLITYLDRAEAIAAFAAALGVRRVQLHGPLAVAELTKLKRLAPRLWVMKSLIVGAANEDQLLHEVADFSPWVDAFITDTFDPATGARGATGKTHDWQASRRLTAASPRPVLLAGGLTPANVGRAVAAVKPAGVDAHSGLEDRFGRKDRALVASFVTAAKAALARIEQQPIRPPRVGAPGSPRAN
ncbi:MAG: hypothetical protein AUK55_12915 [Syntrophobacteraceae bacterium CG2_30_61_12]|nr:MAG: hypothetical protein AUK55_12915 [Syntrophobacteraceae bacterium CG2_30_61_12]